MDRCGGGAFAVEPQRVVLTTFNLFTPMTAGFTANVTGPLLLNFAGLLNYMSVYTLCR